MTLEDILSPLNIDALNALNSLVNSDLVQISTTEKTILEENSANFLNKKKGEGKKIYENSLVEAGSDHNESIQVELKEKYEVVEDEAQKNIDGSNLSECSSDGEDGVAWSVSSVDDGSVNSLMDDDDLMMMLAGDSDDENGYSAGSYFGSVHEMNLHDIPIEPFPFEVAPSEIPMTHAGHIYGLVDGKQLVIETLPESSPSSITLDFDTLIILEDRMVIGRIFDIFGPVRSPFYSVILKDTIMEKLGLMDDKNHQLNDKDIHDKLFGKKIYYLPTLNQSTLNISNLQLFKGSDASNAFDEEPDENEVEFSDDEKETLYKQSKKNLEKFSKKKPLVDNAAIVPDSSLLLSTTAISPLSFTDRGSTSANILDDYEPLKRPTLAPHSYS